MLHQTLPTFLSIQSFCSSSAIPSSRSSSSSPQVKSMEGVGVESKALKASFWPENGLKSSFEPVCEDVWVENVIPGDDFFVDDLLDFSKDEVFNGEGEGEEDKDFLSVSSQEDNQNDNNSNGVSVKDDYMSLPSSELSVPAEDLEQLEWLSHFVEDSFSEYSLPLPYPMAKTETPKSETETETGVETGMGKMEKIETLTTPFPAKARSKRSRTGGRVWSLGSSPSFAETSVSSSSSTSSGSSASISCLIFTNTTPSVDFIYHYDRPPAKKQKKRRVVEVGVGGGGGGAQVQRRCSHCGVQKTPQWRQGPQGAKTLCNACGVRFKSGRLLPEYRPASSPTFSSDVHSNNHRKVLEMRKKKESETEMEMDPVRPFANPVQSF